MSNIKNYLLVIVGLLTMFSCTKDTGNVEIRYQEATAIYGDMKEIRSLELNSGVREIVNPGKIYIGNSFLFIGEEGEGIHVVNNEDRTNPLQIGFISIPGNREFFVDGKMLYAESYYDMLKIDISNPNSPSLVSRAEYAIQDAYKDNEGRSLIGFSYQAKTITLDQNDDFLNEIIGDQLVYLDFARNVIPNSSIPSSFAGNSSSRSGTVNRITKSGDYIYVVSNNNMIILNDTQSSFSSDFNRIENIKEDMETIFSYGDKLFIGSKSSMAIFDISKADAPREIFNFEHATSCDPVLPIEETAYITLRTADFSDCPGNINALLVIDIKNLSNPTQVKEIAMASPFGMCVIQNRLFVGEGLYGLKIFDISSKHNPVLLKEYKEIEAYDIIPSPENNNIIFIAGPNGLDQFFMDESLSFTLESTLKL